MITYLTCKNGFYEKADWSSGCWVNVVQPSKEEIHTLREKFFIPKSFLDDIEDVEERPRVEDEEGWRLIILRVPHKTQAEKHTFTTVPMGILMKGDIFISVCYYGVEMIDDYITFSRRKNYAEKNLYDLLLHLFLSSTVWFMKYLKFINWGTKEAENHLTKSVRNEELLELMSWEKTLVYFITSIRGNEVLFTKLKAFYISSGINYDPDLMEDVEIELQQARTMANIHSDILTGMMDAFASIVSNNLNVVMKRMTAASIILMVPTLIASFYGMNVPNQLQTCPYAFLTIVVISILLVAIMIYIFYKQKWI